jgi:chorismate mutase
MRFYAIRAAASLEEDSKLEMEKVTASMMEDLMSRNALTERDLVSIIFTATPDIHSLFPATALRKHGFQEVPLLCAQEMDVPNAPKLIIRAMVNVQLDRDFSPIHIYQGRAVALRPDLNQTNLSENFPPDQTRNASKNE